MSDETTDAELMAFEENWPDPTESPLGDEPTCESTPESARPSKRAADTTSAIWNSTRNTSRTSLRTSPYASTASSRNIGPASLNTAATFATAIFQTNGRKRSTI